MTNSSSTRRLLRWLRRVFIVMAALALVILLGLSLSPWPGAMLVRATFKQGGEEMRHGLVPFERDDVDVLSDVTYLKGDPDALMDVYIPAVAKAGGIKLPVVVWVHGGGWIGGDKSETRGYFMHLANEGFVVIALNYSLAPESNFPKPLVQINAALAYVTANAARFHVDPARVFMAGDSAGAQLTAQTASITTNPAHAAEIGIDPTLLPEQLRGLILHCGLYDLVTYMKRSAQAGGFIGYGVRILPWAYTGQRVPDDGTLRMISPMLHATRDFPPVFISGGNGDPLTEHQSRPMADHLQQLGVPVTTLFFPDDHRPSLPHEYQFQLAGQDAQMAFSMTLTFLMANSGTPGT